MSDESWITKRRLTEDQARAIAQRARKDAPHISLRIEDLGENQSVIGVLKHRDVKKTNADLSEVRAMAEEVLGYAPNQHEIGLSHLYALGEAKPKTR